MSYIDDLNQAATEALAASSSATDSAQIMFDVANGGETTTVTTANGEVKTLAKAIKDIIDSIEAGVEAPQVEPQTLSAGQTTVSLTTMTTEGIAVYVEGSREFDFTVVNSTDFDFGQSFPDGTRVWIVKRDIEGTADSFTVNTSTGTQTLSDSLDNRVIYVNTIADLQALPTSELVDGQRANVNDDSDFTWDSVTSEWLPTKQYNRVEISPANNSQLSDSLSSNSEDTVLTPGTYDLSAPYTPSDSGKRVFGAGNYSKTRVNAPNGFLNNDASQNGTVVEGVSIHGDGEGFTTTPLLNNQDLRNGHIKDCFLNDADTLILHAGGWGTHYESLELRVSKNGFKTEPTGVSGWSGSSVLFTNPYVAVGRDEGQVGISDSRLWNATYINPVFEYCDTPYAQDASGSQTLIINPWFEANRNPPAYRRNTCIIGGRGQSFSDVSLFAGTNAITNIDGGVEVFNKHPDTAAFSVDGQSVKRMKGSLSTTGIGFSPRYVDDGTGNIVQYDGIEIKDCEQYSQKGIFGGFGSGSGTPAENRYLVMQGYGSYYAGDYSNAIDTDSPCAEISLVGQKWAGAVAVRGEIHFGIQQVGQTAGNGEPPAVLKAKISSLEPGTDNAYALGSASFRYSEVFAATGTINTSDGNMKTDVEALDQSEQSVANTLKGMIKKYRYKDAVEKKGDDARIHVGVMAQEVEQAFLDEGLTPERYGLFCRDVWHTYNGEIVDVNEDGKYVEIVGDSPETAEQVIHETERHERLGIRYDELLAFVISAI